MSSKSSTTTTLSSNTDNKPQQSFSLAAVHDCFTCCLITNGEDDQEVDMKNYLAGWYELTKFLDTLGTLFHFVTHDVKQKCMILEGYLKQDESNYTTIDAMVRHEIATKSTKNKHKPSGSRTLLRLHRALNYLIHFFDQLVSAEDTAKCSTISIESYQATLGKHHTWIIRKAAQLAMYSLPHRSVLLQRIDTTPGSEDVTIQLIHGITESAHPIYNLVETLYAKENLLDLP